MARIFLKAERHRITTAIPQVANEVLRPAIKAEILVDDFYAVNASVTLKLIRKRSCPISTARGGAQRSSVGGCWGRS